MNINARILLVGTLLVGTIAAADDDLGLKVAPGFRVSIVADQTLADDVYAMTLDSQGRIAVTSRGHIKILHDDDGDGRSDRATLFAETATGGMGLCFDGPDLLFCGDGWLSRYRDRDGDGRADGPAERIIPLRFAEHGGHAMRKGPDGCWYVIGGNDSGIDRRHANGPRSPVHDPEAGALLRLADLGGPSEVFAHGFRNPYDFDFNESGDIFTYDSDVERDYFLPWYSPTRIYHVARGGHHGWRVTGFMRSWARKSDYLDTIDILWPIGRGSPTGVVCYRHDLFPEHYRGGVFALDWTFGKVYFLPLEVDGASYRTTAEVFIEPTGTHGFDPTDAVVAPDGSLLISIGGRKTRGAIYRVEPIDSIQDQDRSRSTDPLDLVLKAPQPLDAWSRARWEPIARRLGAGPFAKASADEGRPDLERVRAIEVLTELFDGLPSATARVALESTRDVVRARVAWSIGRKPVATAPELLANLALDRNARVRLAALDALDDLEPSRRPPGTVEAIVPNLDQPAKRARQASARLASRLDDGDWDRLQAAVAEGSPRARLHGALAGIWRHPEADAHPAAIEAALAVLGADRDQRFDAIRLLMLALGDYALANPPLEVQTAYALARPVPPEFSARFRDAVRPIVPSGHDRLNEESARLLAMLEDDDPATLRKVVTFLNDDSPPTRDVHYLDVASRLRSPRDAESTRRISRAVLGLDRKLQGGERRIKQSWGDRIAELVAALADRDDRLADALLDDPEFARPGHVALATALDDRYRDRAARRFLDAVRAHDDFEWSAPLVSLLARLPADEVRPLLRSRWEDVGLRDPILLQLAEGPEEADRARFLTGLESVQPQVVTAALEALGHLSIDPAPEHLVPLLKLLRRLETEPPEKAMRERVRALIARQAGRSFAIQEGANDRDALARADRPVFEWFERAHPAEALNLEGESSARAERDDLLKNVDWSAGHADRGAAIFARSCRACHESESRIGPDLAGASSRFARADLLMAILDPSREVAPPYRVTVVETRDGQIQSGIVAFESADGLILQGGTTGTLRLATPEIVARQASPRSLMPEGLLKELKAAEVADLVRYLETLGGPGPKTR